MLELKGFQQRSLEALETYLRRAVTMGADTAFYDVTKRPYLSVSKLPALPYVCLRVPTGGGKTFMACHAVGIATKEYQRQDHALCLWLVPSKPIREQTLRALCDRNHPYRQGIEAKVSGPVEVMDLTEALYVQRGQLTSQTVIVVSTLQALRVTDMEGRKIYESAGALQHHFSGLPEPLLAALERAEDGVIPFSLANVFRLHRPIIIMDEAHNARTPLSFDTLARLQPSCVIEFTATPETTQKPEQDLYASNILHHCSAAELKSDDMIKLPVKLEAPPDPRQAMAHAVQMQRELEKTALEEEKRTGEYLRPIVLLQAEPKGEGDDRFTVEKVKQCLVTDFKVDEKFIAISTGENDEIEGIKLSERECPVRFIITVQKLTEGWDCPFAYVLCSVKTVHSARAVEQVLGRVLRLPRARRKVNDDLNCAYAFVSSPAFDAAARSLRDALIENGFLPQEAYDALLAAQQGPAAAGELPLFREPIVEPVAEAPDLSKLDAPLRDKVFFDKESSTIRVLATLSDADLPKLEQCFSLVSAKEVAQRILARRHGILRPKSPSEQGLSFRVPQLAIRVDGQLALFEEDHFLGEKWNLTDADATFTEAQFPTTARYQNAAAFDVKANGRLDVELTYAEVLFKQLTFLSGERGWTVKSLVNWLDGHIAHPDLTWVQATQFIDRVVMHLTESRGLTVEQIAQEKIRLRGAIAARIDEIRFAQRKRGFQHMLFEGGGAIEVSPEQCFQFAPDKHPANAYYEGTLRLPNHYYPRIADMNDEEAECASVIAHMDEVEYWVRNIERRPETSYWLPTTTDRFYPDFVAKLKDGRLLLVEYKRENDWSNDDSKEKRAIGDRWAEKSNGRCLFVMPKGKDWAAIRNTISRT